MEAQTDITELLEHQPFLLRLAHGLVGDPHQADDVVQQAWLTALAREPRHAGSPRGWLAGVVRHTALRLLRSDQRRTAREQTAAQPEAIEDNTSISAQLEAQRHVTEALQSLPEPYRSTLFLRYFKDLGPAAIAAEQGVPVATVKSRLSRGIALLRQSLDARYGGERRSWCTALIGLGAQRRPPAIEMLSVGMLAMTTKLAMLAFGGGAVALLALLLWVRGGDTPRPTPGADAANTAAALTAEPPAPEPAREALRAPVDAPPSRPGAQPPVEAPATPTTLRGRVVDSNGTPLAGVELWQSDRDEDASPLFTDAEGGFAVPVPEASASFGVRTPGWKTVWHGVFHPEMPTVEPIVIAVRGVRWAGRVRTPAGAPVAHATLRVQLQEALSSRLGLRLDGGRENTWPITADEDGRFALDDAPAVPGATLSVTAGSDYVPVEVAAPAGASEQVDIVLEPRAASGGAITGRVFDRSGAPVAAATVVLGRDSTRTDEKGAFRLSTERLRAGARLVAIAPGRQPGILEDPAGRGAAVPGWPAHVDVVLGDLARTIRGRALDADGTPLPNVTVWIDDMTYAGVVNDQMSFVEPLVAANPFSESTTTDADGAFELAGLMDRPYRVGLFHGETLRGVARDDIQAGTSDVIVRFPPVDRGRVVRGRLVSRTGAPVPGVAVGLNVLYRTVRIPGMKGGASTHRYSGGHTVTDANGEFTIAGAPPEFDGIILGGDHVMPQTWDLPEGADRSGLEIPVALRCHAQIVAIGELATAEYAALLDGEDQPLSLVQFSGRSSRSSSLIALRDGRSPVFTVSDHATTLVLRRGTEIVHRQVVELTPGETTRIEAR